MKRLKSITAAVATVAVAAAVSITINGGTAYADPLDSAVQGPIGYETSVTPEGAVSTVLDAGAFRIDMSDNTVDVVDNLGSVLASLPLAYSVNGQTYSIAPALVGDRNLLLTPSPVALINDAAGPVNKQAALDNAINQMAIGYANGGAIGTAIGAGLGFAIGCVSIFPNFISGCIIGTAIGAVAGTIIGTSNANPNVQPAVFDYFAAP